ncbi:MAG TPA: alpha/beta hydrolase [Chloroflexia bacterium]|nr:alpha/beta hydrolase [Chloroflexia bacterium]
MPPETTTILKTFYHPITDRDRLAVAQLKATLSDLTIEFEPTTRSFFDEMMQHTPKAPGVTYVQAQVGGVAGWWCSPQNAAPERAILYFHGGAYNIGSARAFCNFAGQIATAAGVDLFVPDYRLAPENPFPAAVQDALAVYQGLVESGYKQIALAGDSAGGGLALVTLAQILSKAASRQSERLVRCAVVLSPWTDLSLSGASITEHAQADPLLKRESLVAAADRYLAGHDPRDPLASPLFGELSDLPPILLQVGESEILLDDARRYAAAIESEGSELHIWEGMPHVFQSSIGVYDAAQFALENIGSFLRKHLD